MSYLIKRIDDYLQGAGEELATVILNDCRAEIQRLLLANETLTALNAEYAERIKALEAKGEPVCYITQAALDALKRGASSSVRVWRKPDERLNGDIALYTKDKP